MYINYEGGDDANDGTESFPVRSSDQAKRIMEQRGHSKCTGIRVLGSKVFTSPCGASRCGSCTKANGRRLCPGEGCDKWISVSAKQHSECGWRKPDADKKPALKAFTYKADDHHGFEKVKRKMLNLARQAAMQYGWDGIIMGYAAKVGRGGSTARITFVSPQNELYSTDERGGIKVKTGLDDHLSLNADNALTLIRQKICPTERLIKHDALLPAGGDEVDHMPVQGPELPPGMEDPKGDALVGVGNELPLQWLAHQVTSHQVTEKRAEMAEMDKGVTHSHVHHSMHHQMHPPAPAPLHPAVLAHSHHVAMHHPHSLAHTMEMHLPMDPSSMDDPHKRKMMHQIDVISKRVRDE